MSFRREPTAALTATAHELFQQVQSAMQQMRQGIDEQEQRNTETLQNYLESCRTKQDALRLEIDEDEAEAVRVRRRIEQKREKLKQQCQEDEAGKEKLKQELQEKVDGIRTLLSSIREQAPETPEPPRHAAIDEDGQNSTAPVIETQNPEGSHDDEPGSSTTRKRRHKAIRDRTHASSSKSRKRARDVRGWAGEVGFDDVYGNPERLYFIQKYRSNFYIFKCEEHNKCFGRNPAAGAGKHLDSNRHGYLGRDWATAIENLGFRVLNCGDEEAKRNNSLFKRERRHRNKGLAHQREQESDDDVLEEALTSAIVTKSGPFLGVTDAEPGQVYQVRLGRSFYPGLVLPTSNFLSVGIIGTMRESYLLGELPKCYRLKDGNTIDWADGFKDGGLQVQRRQFPVVYFDDEMENEIPAEGDFQLPRYRRVQGWACAKDMRPFNLADPACQRLNGFVAVKKFLGRMHPRHSPFGMRAQADEPAPTPVTDITQESHRNERHMSFSFESVEEADERDPAKDACDAQQGSPPATHPTPATTSPPPGCSASPLSLVMHRMHTATNQTPRQEKTAPDASVAPSSNSTPEPLRDSTHLATIKRERGPRSHIAAAFASHTETPRVRRTAMNPPASSSGIAMRQWDERIETPRRVFDSSDLLAPWTGSSNQAWSPFV